MDQSCINDLLRESDSEVDEEEGVMVLDVGDDWEEGEEEVVLQEITCAGPSASGVVASAAQWQDMLSSDDEDVAKVKVEVMEQPISPVSSDDEDVARVKVEVMEQPISPVSSDDEDIARVKVEVTEWPISPVLSALPRFDIRVSPPPTVGRGGATTRGWGRGRGGGRGARRGKGGWNRGDPLVARFVSDDELPVHLQQSIRQVLSAREVRERSRGQGLLDVEVEDDLNDNLESTGHEEARDFLDCGEFEWRPMDDGTFNGARETFLGGAPGPTGAFTTAYQAFRFYWDDGILSYIAAETNRYAEGLGRASESFRKTWYPTNAHEIIVLFTFWMMLSIVRMPSIKSCFSTLPILKTGIFRLLLSEQRYWNLNRAFHLANGSRDPGNPDNLLYPMGPLLEHLNSKFKQGYRLEPEISLTLWKGALKSIQYIKTKAARWGIKMYELCESSTGYLWGFFVYVEKNHIGNSRSMPTSAGCVLSLLRPLLNLGHVVFMDNLFNSPILARYLKKNHTDCVGTVRPNRKHMPLAIQKAQLKEGEYVARHSGDVAVVALQDRRRLSCLSTFHDMSQMQTAAKPGRSSQHKLQLIKDYNHGMGGVDRLDQMLDPYLIQRKQCKWTKKLLKHVLNASIQNARVLVEKSTNKNIKSVSFRIGLVQALVDEHLKHVPERSKERRSQAFDPIERFNTRQQHFVQRIRITEEMAQRHVTNQGRRQCVYCSLLGKRNSRSVYECSECKVPLCLEPCFRLYHTQQ